MALPPVGCRQPLPLWIAAEPLLLMFAVMTALRPTAASQPTATVSMTALSGTTGSTAPKTVGLLLVATKPHRRPTLRKQIPDDTYAADLAAPMTAS